MSTKEHLISNCNLFDTSALGDNSKQNIKSSTKDKYPPEFIQFYYAYPKNRQQGYVAPFRSWLKLAMAGELPPLDTLLDAIDKAKKSEHWSEPKYIPMMTTWLNQKRWEAKNVNHSEVANEMRFLADKETQQVVAAETVAGKNEQIAKLVYNITKFLPYDEKLIESIIRFFIERDVTFYINTDPFFAIEYVFIDAIDDIVFAKLKTDNFKVEDANQIIGEYFSTIVSLILCRYCDCDSAELVKELPFNEKESLHLRKVLKSFTDADTCERLRVKYNIRAVLNHDSWLLAFTPDEFLFGVTGVL